MPPGVTPALRLLLCAGSLCTVTTDGLPLAAPVTYRLDAAGNPVLQVVTGSAEAAALQSSTRCSLLVQPAAFPARGLGSVALQGAAEAADSQEGAAASGTSLVKLAVDSCMYYGGLDHVSAVLPHHCHWMWLCMWLSLVFGDMPLVLPWKSIYGTCVLLCWCSVPCVGMYFYVVA